MASLKPLKIKRVQKQYDNKSKSLLFDCVKTTTQLREETNEFQFKRGYDTHKEFISFGFMVGLISLLLIYFIYFISKQ